MLTLSARSAYLLTEQRKNGKAELVVDGDAEDKLNLKGLWVRDFSQIIDGRDL